jgi:NAD(P)-dependent dehydrogenase (short-subunit alcohol dehydrogenase family)
VPDAGAGLLKHKTAFITGAARGIGLAVSRAYHEQGASVVMADVMEKELAEAAAALGDRVATVRLDVTDEAATDEAVAFAVERFGKVDLVVPNAGILVLKHAVDIPLAEWKRVIDVNLTGIFITAKAFAKQLIAQGSGGRIIMTSSLFGLRGGRENSAYSAAKFGMIGLMECMAAELAPHDIQVNCVCPGQIDTDMNRQLLIDRSKMKGIGPDEVRKALLARIPGGKLGTLDELVGTYVWLASDFSRYVTGQSIAVDGGWQVG